MVNLGEISAYTIEQPAEGIWRLITFDINERGEKSIRDIIETADALHLSNSLIRNSAPIEFQEALNNRLIGMKHRRLF